MLIGFLGDVHGRVFHALGAVLAWQQHHGRRFDRVILVGDIGAFPDATRFDAPTRRHAEADPSVLDFSRLVRASGDLAGACIRLAQRAVTIPAREP